MYEALRPRSGETRIFIDHVVVLLFCTWQEQGTATNCDSSPCRVLSCWIRNPRPEDCTCEMSHLRSKRWRWNDQKKKAIRSTQHDGPPSAADPWTLIEPNRNECIGITSPAESHYPTFEGRGAPNASRRFGMGGANSVAAGLSAPCRPCRIPGRHARAPSSQSLAGRCGLHSSGVSSSVLSWSFLS